MLLQVLFGFDLTSRFRLRADLALQAHLNAKRQPRTRLVTPYQVFFSKRRTKYHQTRTYEKSIAATSSLIHYNYCSHTLAPNVALIHHKRPIQGFQIGSARKRAHYFHCTKESNPLQELP